MAGIISRAPPHRLDAPRRPPPIPPTEPPVELQVVVRHDVGREPSLEYVAHAGGDPARGAPTAATASSSLVDDEAGDARRRSPRAPSRSARRSRACRRPWPRSSPGRTAPANRSGTAGPWRCPGSRTSAASPISPMNSISGSSQHRLDHFVEVGPVDGVDLGRDLEAHARALRDLDGPVGALFRRDPAEEGQIAVARRLGEAIQACRERRDGLWRASSREAGAGAGRCEIETSGYCGQRAYAADRSFRSSRPCSVVTVRAASSPKNGKCIMSTMEMEDVELLPPPMQFVQHRRDGPRGRTSAARVEPDCLIAHRHQRRLVCWLA